MQEFVPGSQVIWYGTLCLTALQLMFLLNVCYCMALLSVAYMHEIWQQVVGRQALPMDQKVHENECAGKLIIYSQV